MEPAQLVKQLFSKLLSAFGPVLILAAFGTPNLQPLSAAEEQPFGIERRIPWSTSRLTGSPEPPLPYTVEKTFPKLKLERPLFVIAEPQTDRLFIIEQGGETNKPSHILEVKDDPESEQVETFLSVTNRLLYSFTFHPG